MGAVDLVLQLVDPGTAALVVGMWEYLKWMKEDLQDDIEGVRGRVARLEGSYIPDGGEEPEGDQ